MAWNAELSNKLLKCARIGQAPEKYHHTQISTILIALFTCEIFAIETHGCHEAMKMRQSELEPHQKHFKALFITRPEWIKGAIWIETFRRIEIARPETEQIILE